MVFEEALDLCGRSGGGDDGSDARKFAEGALDDCFAQELHEAEVHQRVGAESDAAGRKPWGVDAAVLYIEGLDYRIDVHARERGVGGEPENVEREVVGDIEQRQESDDLENGRKLTSVVCDISEC